jgi:transcriptional adapter 2-alpha
MNKLNFPLFSHDWTAEEELLFFEGLEKFGYGNWADIVEHMATDKTKEDMELHYE